jgi:hypothetical protein
VITPAAVRLSAEPATALSPTPAPPTTTSDHRMDRMMDPADQAAAMLATADFQDVATAEAAGYTSTVDTLGCFQNPAHGGMGVHYVDQDLVDDHVDLSKPEALVYEFDATGQISGLVAHEYIVPIDTWTSSTPPSLSGIAFHKHPTLPLWILHTWLWKDNPTGIFQDWNPAVRQCPTGLPIFGIDLPGPTPTNAAATATSIQSRLGPR